MRLNLSSLLSLWRQPARAAPATAPAGMTPPARPVAEASDVTAAIPLGDVEAVLTQVFAWKEAERGENGDALRRLLGPDAFRYTSAPFVGPRQWYFEPITTQMSQIRSWALDDVIVQVYGDFAVVHARQTQTLRVWSYSGGPPKSVTGASLLMLLWQRESGTWMLCGHHSLQLADPKELERWQGQGDAKMIADYKSQTPTQHSLRSPTEEEEEEDEDEEA